MIKKNLVINITQYSKPRIKFKKHYQRMVTYCHFEFFFVHWSVQWNTMCSLKRRSLLSFCLLSCNAFSLFFGLSGLAEYIVAFDIYYLSLPGNLHSALIVVVYLLIFIFGFIPIGRKWLQLFLCWLL